MLRLHHQEWGVSGTTSADAPCLEGHDEAVQQQGLCKWVESDAVRREHGRKLDLSRFAIRLAVAGGADWHGKRCCGEDMPRTHALDVSSGLKQVLMNRWEHSQLVLAVANVISASPPGTQSLGTLPT